MPTARQLRARAAVVLAAALFASAGCNASAPSSPGASAASAAPDAIPGTTAPPLPPPTAWERALANVDDEGRFSLDAALTLFATAYGPLPGVDVEQDLTGVGDMSIAIRAVMSHRDELTAEQLAAIDRALEIPDGAAVVTIPPVGTVRSNVTLAAISKEQQDFLRRSAASWRERIAVLLDRDFIGDLDIAFIDTKGPPVETRPGQFAAGDASSEWPGGVFGGCRIRLFSDFTSSLPTARDQILAHEVFHCFQLDGYRTEEAAAEAPAWIMEGQANWVSGYLIDFVNYEWLPYLQKPQQKLTTRSYDAIGFYAHLDETGVSPWNVMADMWLAGTNNAEAFIASGANTSAFLDSVASAVVLLPNLGTAWTTDGSGMVPAEYGYRSADIRLGNGGSLSFSAPIFTSDIKTIHATSDIVHFTFDGHARLADGEFDTASFQDAYYCVEGHKCEAETSCPGNAPAIVISGTINPRFLFAMAGGLEATTAQVQGIKFEEPPKECTPEPTDDEFCRKYRDYVAWAESLGPDADVTQALAAEVARRFDDMYPVAPAEMQQWVILMWQIYSTFAGTPEPYNIPKTGNLGGISKLPDALMAMHAYCGIPWPAG